MKRRDGEIPNRNEAKLVQGNSFGKGWKSVEKHEKERVVENNFKTSTFAELVEEIRIR